MTYIGIDPGSKGFLTVMNDCGVYAHHSIASGDMLDVMNFIQKIKEESKEPVKAIMEETHAIFGSSAKATFAFGEINGYLKGALTALHIPYTLIQPKLWQKEIWQNQDMEHVTKTDKNGKTKKMVNTKQTSYNACRRLFPDIDVRKTEKCKNFDDNKVDSILIAEYARRKNL